MDSSLLNVVVALAPATHQSTLFVLMGDATVGLIVVRLFLTVSVSLSDYFFSVQKNPVALYFGVSMLSKSAFNETFYKFN